MKIFSIFRQKKQQNQQEFSCINNKQQTTNKLKKDNHSIERFYQKYLVIQKDVSFVDKILNKNTGKVNNRKQQQKKQSEILYLKEKNSQCHQSDNSVNKQKQVYDCLGIKFVFPNKKESQNFIQKINKLSIMNKQLRDYQNQPVQQIIDYFIEKVSSFCSSHINVFLIFNQWKDNILSKAHDILIRHFNSKINHQSNKKISLRNTIQTGNLNYTQNSNIGSASNNFINSYYTTYSNNTTHKASSTSTLPTIRNKNSPHIKLINPESHTNNQQKQGKYHKNRQLQLKLQLLRCIYRVCSGLKQLFDVNQLPYDIKIQNLIYKPTEKEVKNSMIKNNNKSQQSYHLMSPFLTSVWSQCDKTRYFPLTANLQQTKTSQLPQIYLKQQNMIQQSTQYFSPQDLSLQLYNNIYQHQHSQQALFNSLLFKLGMIILQIWIWSQESWQFLSQMQRQNKFKQSLDSFIQLEQVAYRYKIYSSIGEKVYTRTEESRRDEELEIRDEKNGVVKKINWLQLNRLLDRVKDDIPDKNLVQQPKINEIHSMFYTITKSLLNRSAAQRRKSLNIINSQSYQRLDSLNREIIISPDNNYNKNLPLNINTNTINQNYNCNASSDSSVLNNAYNNKFYYGYGDNTNNIKKEYNSTNFQWHNANNQHNMNNNLQNRYLQEADYIQRTTGYFQKADNQYNSNMQYHRQNSSTALNSNPLLYNTNTNNNRTLSKNTLNPSNMPNISNITNLSGPQSIKFAQGNYDYNYKYDKKPYTKQFFHHYSQLNQPPSSFRNINNVTNNSINSDNNRTVYEGNTNKFVYYPHLNNDFQNNYQQRQNTNDRTTLLQQTVIVSVIPQPAAYSNSQNHYQHRQQNEPSAPQYIQTNQNQINNYYHPANNLSTSLTNIDNNQGATSNKNLIGTSYNNNNNSIYQQWQQAQSVRTAKQSKLQQNIRLSQYLTDQSNNGNSQNNLQNTHYQNNNQKSIISNQRNKLNSIYNLKNDYIKIQQYSEEKPKTNSHQLSEMSLIQRNQDFNTASLEISRNLLMKKAESSPGPNTTPVSNSQQLKASSMKKSMDIPPHDQTHTQIITPNLQNNLNKNSQSQLEYVIKDYYGGAHYQGYIKNNKRNGHGKFFYPQGSLYDGQWSQDRMNGYGLLYYNTGQLAYEGQWLNDQFYGQGKVHNHQPTMLDQSFDYTNFNNLQQQWVYYEGQLNNDLKQGHGIIMLENGEWFQGEFKKDRINGEGKFVNLQGEIIKGIWKDSVMIERLD